MNEFSNVVRDIDGVLVPGAKVYIYGPDGDLAQLYASDGVTPQANPLVADDFGLVSAKITEDGFYRTEYFWGGRKRWGDTVLLGLSPIQQAESFASLAEEFSGPAYANTAAGVAATTVGQFFRVPIGTSPETYTRYERTGTSPFYRVAAPLATSAALATTTGAALIGKTGGGTVQDAINQSLQMTTLSLTDTWTPGLVTAKFGRTIKASANHQTLPEVGHYVELNQTVEPTGPLGTVYKIGWGGIVKSTATAPELYGMNPVIDGKFGPSFGQGICIEADVNNRGAHADTIASATSAYGFIAASGGTKRITAAFWSPGYFATPEPNYGFAATGFHNLASFYDSTDAPAVLDIRGAHTYGIDTRNAAAMSYAMMLKNNLPLSGVQTNGTTVSNFLKYNTSNILELGDTNVAYIQVNQALVPKTDNTYSLGTGALRWGQIYSGTGTISTSDPSLKKDIAPLDLNTARALLGAVNPITFRFIAGGVTVTQVEEDGEVPETILVPDGEYEESVPVQVGTDDNGEPIYSIEKRTRPKHRFETRMVPGKVMRDVVTETPGKRLHFGFNAEEVGKALADLKINSALYVVDEGVKMLRQEQFIAILWTLMRDFSERLAAVEAAK